MAVKCCCFIHLLLHQFNLMSCPITNMEPCTFSSPPTDFAPKRNGGGCLIGRSVGPNISHSLDPAKFLCLSSNPIPFTLDVCTWMCHHTCMYVCMHMVAGWMFDIHVWDHVWTCLGVCVFVRSIRSLLLYDISLILHSRKLTISLTYIHSLYNTYQSTSRGCVGEYMYKFKCERVSVCVWKGKVGSAKRSLFLLFLLYFHGLL